VGVDLAGGHLMAINKREEPAGAAVAIEPMRVADLDAVIDIERACFPTASTAQVLLEEMARDWAFVDVVRDVARGRVVAFGNYWVVADEVHLLNIATHPDARRAGHASRLLAHIIALGRARKCRIVTLEVRRSNADATRLYRRFGFRPVGVRHAYYSEDQEDAVVMLLDLA
jgi:[ribosomal protein S18]-alanine N-acetyltransferase